MSRPRYRFTPSLLSKWTDFVDSEALYQEFYGNSDEPSVSLEEFEAKQEAELWDAINRVPQEPSEAASRGTLLNVIVDCKVQWERPDAKYNIRRISDENGRMVAISGECDGFHFEYDAALCRMLFDYFKGCICQYRCEAEIDTCFGPVILYGDPDYIRRDKVFDLNDLVAMQNWLLARPNSDLADWKAGDLCEDGVIDVFDLIAMRRALLEDTSK